MAFWVGERLDGLKNSVFFSVLPFLVETERPGYLKSVLAAVRTSYALTSVCRAVCSAVEFVTFVDRLCTMRLDEAAKFVFYQLVNAETACMFRQLSLFSLNFCCNVYSFPASVGDPAVDLLLLKNTNRLLKNSLRNTDANLNQPILNIMGKVCKIGRELKFDITVEVIDCGNVHGSP